MGRLKPAQYVGGRGAKRPPRSHDMFMPMNDSRSLSITTGLGALALIVTCLSTALRLTAQDAAQQAKVAKPIKVMSFNIRQGGGKDKDNRWEKRAYLVAETIEMFNPDLLGTQEVLGYQAAFLKKEMPGYGYHGVGRKDGKTRGEYELILFRKQRFELIDSGHFWLSEKPQTPGSKSWDTSHTRMVSWVRLKDLKNASAEFIFMNTHFDHIGRTARLESARMIRKRAEGFMAEGIPIIISGDFNTTEDGKPYAELVTGSKGNEIPLLDSFRVSNPNRSADESTSTRWVGNRTGRRIDWILHSRDFSTLQSVINHSNDSGRYPSDHYPVQAILRLKPRE